MTTLSFKSNGSLLAAKLNLPAADDSSRKPGVIVVGSWLTVKEQMPANYAPLLAAAGFVALTFDFRGFGVSEGLLREVESAKSKAEDILNAAAFLGTRPEVDSDRIAVLAICASASYTALALQGASPDTSSVKSVAMVAPWIHDAELVAQLYGGEEAVRARLLRARAARERYVQTGEVEYIQAASNQDQSAAMYGAGDMLDYYLNPERGAVPEWGARFGVMGWTEWLQSDFVTLAPQFALPLCMVTGPGTATPAGAKKFAAALPDKPQVVSLDGTQFDFYDKPEQVRASCARAVAHFHSTLG